MSKPNEYAPSAHFRGVEYFFLELIENHDGSDLFVLCESNQGTKKCIELHRWISASPSPINISDADISSKNIITKAQVPVTTSKSSNTDKISLFRSYFKGREDVYAKSYFSKKLGKLQYIPACVLEWKKPVCKKPTIRCSECKHRKLAALTDKILVKHMIGRKQDGSDAIGIYPLIDGDKTYFLAADFDGNDWKQEAIAYHNALLKFGINSYIERSRSGCGAHVWIFFEDAVNAKRARALGTMALSKAMEECDRIAFTSYDRLFPNQDVVPQGGFGNLIALPFQGQAVARGNSIFLDEHLEPYPDQWRALATFKKTGKSKLDSIIPDNAEEALGFLIATANEGEPWRKRASTPALIHEDATMQIIKANMLYVDKTRLKASTINSIRRLAAFANPDYYRASAMRQSLRNIPRIIYAGNDTPKYICLPRGCEDDLVNLLEQNSIRYRISDEREHGSQLDISFNGTLRPMQGQALSALLQHENGVLSAATGFGKTILAAALIAEVKTPTLILVPNTALLNQWRKRLLDFLEINEELPPLLTKTGKKSRKQRSVVGQIGAGKNIPSGIVDVAIPASLLENGETPGEKAVKSFVKDYGIIICDECHHVASSRYEQVVTFANAQRVYGLSATPMRKDGLDPIIFMQCGPIRFEYDGKTQSIEQSFKRILVPRFTQFRIDEQDSNKSFTALVEDLCNDRERNALIAEDASSLVETGKTVLVLTRRIKHAQHLEKLLTEKEFECLLLIGSDDKKTREEKLSKLADPQSQKPTMVVATGDYVGEGFDYDKLDALILAAPVSWKGLLSQYAGRLHREHDDKDEVVIYDYADVHVPTLDNMYRKRLRQYAALGYEARMPENDGTAAHLFSGEEYVKHLISDISSAQHSINISSPSINAKKIAIIAPSLLEACARGVAVSLVTGNVKNDEKQCDFNRAFKPLVDAGAIINSKDRTACLVIIDSKIVWYGSVSVLAFNKRDYQCLRFESRAIAGDILKEG